MTIDELLTLAACNWRGKPYPYTAGLLGDIGPRFRDAFERGYPESGATRSLAFEYFAGLVFNADYSDLASYIALVKSWLVVVPGLSVIVPACVKAFSWNVFPDVVPLVNRGAVDSWWSMSYPCVSGEWRWWLSHPVEYSAPYWWRLGLSFDHYGGWMGDRWYEWARSQTEGFVGSYAPGYGASAPAGCFVLVESNGGVGVFEPIIESAVARYAAGEQIPSRDYPEPLATAQAQNGYVFANWAAEKYGVPFAG